MTSLAFNSSKGASATTRAAVVAGQGRARRPQASSFTLARVATARAAPSSSPSSSSLSSPRGGTTGATATSLFPRQRALSGRVAARAGAPAGATASDSDSDSVGGEPSSSDAFEPLSDEEQAKLDFEAAAVAAELEDADLAMSDSAVVCGDDEDEEDEVEEDEVDGLAGALAAGDATMTSGDDEETASPSTQQQPPPRTRPTPLRRLPRLVILGRPNVGKSALFNRIVGDGRAAVVADFAGVTRDALFSRARWRGREFAVVDTGGLMAAGAAEEAAAAAASAARTFKEKKRASAAVSEAAAAAAVAAAPGSGHLPEAVEAAAAAAALEADALLVVVDGATGLTAADLDVIQWARSRKGSNKKGGGKKKRTPLLLAVNKCDNSARAAAAIADAWQAGVEPIPVSALSGSGSGDLLDAVLEALPETRPRRKVLSTGTEAEMMSAETDATIADDEEFDEEEEDNEENNETTTEAAKDARRARRPLAVAIVGRPNAGKSSLLNAIAGGTRAIVSPVAGTTRDAVDAVVKGPPGSAADGVGSRPFRLVDTAGIRRRAAVSSSPTDAAEGLAVGRALSAMRRADVVALVVDAAACSRDGRFVATAQDFRLAEAIAQAGRACVIVLNKWDAVPNREPSTVATFEAEVRAQLRPVAWAPVVHASAASGRRVAKVLSAAAAAGDQHARRLSTATLNMVVRDAVTWRGPPGNRSSPKKGRVYYATQPTTRPPTFVLFVNDVSLFPDDYRRYVERSLRAAAGFAGTSLRVVWRGKPPREQQQRDPTAAGNMSVVRSSDGSFAGKSSVMRAKRGKSGYGAKKGK